jgi:hypothetical protein
LLNIDLRSRLQISVAAETDFFSGWILSNGEKNLIAEVDGVNSKILVQSRKTSPRICAEQRGLRNAEKRIQRGFSCDDNARAQTVTKSYHVRAYLISTCQAQEMQRPSQTLGEQRPATFEC